MVNQKIYRSTRRAMYCTYKWKIEVHSCNHCCSGKQ